MGILTLAWLTKIYKNGIFCRQNSIESLIGNIYFSLMACVNLNIDNACKQISTLQSWYQINLQS
jgi:hypothetical protein